ncbi:MAG TPA: hypothetical protein VMX77_02370 [Candidatus Bathyarchaeia archaeon]|nr:hypothetical protein [Candidatus Bathyarchaeia archaeon]
MTSPEKFYYLAAESRLCGLCLGEDDFGVVVFLKCSTPLVANQVREIVDQQMVERQKEHLEEIHRN